MTNFPEVQKMKKLNFFFFIGCLAVETHYLDIGVTFLRENFTFMLVQEKTVTLNLLQPITLATSNSEDQNSPFYLNTLTEISRVFGHNGMDQYVNNLTEETYSCQDGGWSGNCPIQTKVNWRPIYYGDYGKSKS